MSLSIRKYTATCIWFFGSLGLGLAQNVPNNIQTGEVNISTDGNVPIDDSISNGMPALIPQSFSNAVLSCLAPPQPANGEWKLDRYYCDDIVDCDVPEGSRLDPGSQLLYQCNPGYKAEGNTDVYCRGRGQLSPIPKCVEVRCASLNSVSTTVSCTRFGKWINCDSPVLPDTRAEVSCRRGYKRDTEFITTRRSVVNCKADGSWDAESIRCVPVCGLAITHQQPFISGGTPANVGDFPWHATLYQEVKTREGTKKVFICGATIIQTNLLLTAAHCVWDETYRTKQDPSKLFVTTGNTFRDYDSPLHNPEIVRKAAVLKIPSSVNDQLAFHLKDVLAVQSHPKVKNVYTYCQYYGLTGNYASDIALLELHEPFQFSSILMPACLDDSEYRDQFLEPGAIGRVAGFGRTATGVSSGNLQTLSIPYVSYSQCKSSNNAAQNEVFISSDKFCAGYSNGSAVCEGDSGGGLVFRKGDLWHVMGIVSVGLGVDVRNGERTCDKYSYSLYTKVSHYMAWIQAVLIDVERNQTYPACSNEVGTTETPIQTQNPNVISGCMAPPRLANGGWKLHEDSCQGKKDCLVPEGTMLQPGSQLVYSCASGFQMKGSVDVYCRLGGTWTSIPTCSGENCIMNNGDPGVCTLIKSCKPALLALKAGNAPENTCGFAGLQPIVCCPVQIESPKDSPAAAYPGDFVPTTIPELEDLEGDGRGAISKQKCTEYSKSVNASICPPFMTYNQVPVNESTLTGKVRASRLEFPHMVALGYDKKDGTVRWQCGGTLISESYVLTAAQCTQSKLAGPPVWARIGELNLHESEDMAESSNHRIVEQIPYPEYEPPSVYHDIALLRLESPVSFNDRVRPACLYTAPSTGTPDAIATGWGKVDVGNRQSNNLMKVTLPLVDQKTCNTSYTNLGAGPKLPGGLIGEWTICAGARGKDTCQGDSGGPMVVYSRKERCMYDVIGITSFGTASCGYGIPTLYTRVYNYIPWIESVVWKQG